MAEANLNEKIGFVIDADAACMETGPWQFGRTEGMYHLIM